MRVKRYVVDSMPDALQKIRSDLGKDAVIINTKEIRSGGFLGLFGKKKIEVIAATDTAGAEVPKPVSQSTPQKPRPNIQPIGQVVATEPERRSDFPDVPDVLVENINQIQKKLSYVQDEPAPSLATKAYNPYAASASVAVAGNVKPREDLLFEEIKQMKEMMRKLSVASYETAVVPEPLLKLEHRLLEQEVSPILVQELVERAMEDSATSGEPITDQSAHEFFRGQINSWFLNSKSKQISHETRVVHFVGPTGVGKTTTIAKLAAEQVIKYQRRVGFITSDTYRIAAIEQLKTYATILNVPIEVVFSHLDLSKAFQSLEGCDVIFMDTAGRNFRNEMYVSELNALLKSKGNSETILVLSLTTKYKDMKAITHNFNKFKLDKVLFTKMDETDSYGSIVNLVHDFSLQLSYVTNGQSVPDDIAEVDEQHIIDLLLGEKAHG
jgi:flagellar biosynthesis protein FlhF